MLCFFDNTDCAVASFAHKIQYEYYGCNVSVSTEGISIYHFSASTHILPFSEPKNDA